MSNASNVEDILYATIHGMQYSAAPESRVEELLIELKAAIEAGGGGTSGAMPVGGTAGQFIKKNSSTDYDAIWASADSSVTENSANLVTSGAVYSAIASAVTATFTTGY